MIRIKSRHWRELPSGAAKFVAVQHYMIPFGTGPLRETVTSMLGTAALLCLVIGIADGDTLTARCKRADGATNVVVRLADIDAPEKRQAFGKRSQQHLADLCFKKPANITPKAIDRYGRTVAHVVCDRVDASVEQVRAGMAWAYTRYMTDPAFSRLEQQARKQQLGLWADGSPVPPWTWRQSARRRSESARCDGPPPWNEICLTAGSR